MDNDMPSIPCQTVLAHLWDFLDQELTPETMAAFRAHLDECPACHPHAAFGEQFLAALGRCRCEDPMPDSCRDKVLSSLREAGLLH